MAAEPPGLIEGFLDCSTLLGRGGGSGRGSPRTSGAAGDDKSSTGGDAYEAEVLEWEERGIWYTPPDAELDVEGTP